MKLDLSHHRDYNPTDYQSNMYVYPQYFLSTTFCYTQMMRWGWLHDEKSSFSFCLHHNDIIWHMRKKQWVYHLLFQFGLWIETVGYEVVQRTCICVKTRAMSPFPAQSLHLYDGIFELLDIMGVWNNGPMVGTLHISLTIAKNFAITPVHKSLVKYAYIYIYI